MFTAIFLDNCENPRRKSFIEPYFPKHPEIINTFSDSDCISYRNQSFILLCNTNDWFPYETQH